MKQVFRHYLDMEEYHSVMWKQIDCKQANEAKLRSVNLFTSADDFTQSCNLVLQEWPNSCECQFTNKATNKIAWLGQAACALVANSPEYVTRLAWSEISQQSQEIANVIAGNTVKEWINLYTMEFDYAQKRFAF